MLADFRLKVDATKDWLTKKTGLMNVKTSIEDFLRIAYAHLRKTLVKIGREVMTTYKIDLIANMQPALESYIQNAELKLQDSMKAKADKLQKRKDEDDKYEQFSHDFKHVALAVYMQKIEHRLIQVVLAADGKKKQAYVHACRGQQLRILQTKAFNLRNEMSENGCPCVKGKTLELMFDRKKERKKPIGPRNKSQSRGRSTSRRSKCSGKGSTKRSGSARQRSEGSQRRSQSASKRQGSQPKPHRNSSRQSSARQTSNTAKGSRVSSRTTQSSRSSSRSMKRSSPAQPNDRRKRSRSRLA
eukprot:TRINITY_DN16178_c0_g2_i1.p1 TRINITY_DN16178_c0_g2~~TRINITY_DN16178_c0_g2_i1.p1  ORF type:complete len:300 (+),score=60.17 TRINITY_DN16178_c0_g2_i1:785-1684(+)